MLRGRWVIANVGLPNKQKMIANYLQPLSVVAVYNSSHIPHQYICIHVDHPSECIFRKKYMILHTIQIYYKRYQFMNRCSLT